MAKRIEKLDNERWKGWDWAASNKLNEVIEAVNTITEAYESIQVDTTKDYEKTLEVLERLEKLETKEN